MSSYGFFYTGVVHIVFGIVLFRIQVFFCQAVRQQATEHLANKQSVNKQQKFSCDAKRFLASSEDSIVSFLGVMVMVMFK